MKSGSHRFSTRNIGGYAFVLLLSVLLGIGVMGTFFQAKRQGNDFRALNVDGLSFARQSLINYAVNYIDMYGVQGAGPGHFPCPDSDNFLTSGHIAATAVVSTADSSKNNSAFRGDGPNPPCGSRAVATGKLPRHISVEHGRYVFHLEPFQRFNYAVDTGFINNPANRIVNSSSVGSLVSTTGDQIVAFISLPRANEPAWRTLSTHELWHRISGSTAVQTISVNDFRGPMMRRVGLWFQEQIEYAMRRNCGKQASSHSEGISGEHRCVVKQFKVASECALDTVSLSAHWLHFAAYIPTLSNASSASKAAAIEIQNCHDYNQALQVRMQLFQNVPYRQHWFFRNQWYKHINVIALPECLDESSQGCHFYLPQPSLSDSLITILYGSTRVQNVKSDE